MWKGCEDISQETHQYISRRTLSGDIMDTVLDSPIETKFHILPDTGTFLLVVSNCVGYLITSAVFTAPHPAQAVTKYSFCLLIKKEHMSKYLNIHPIVEDSTYCF